MVTTALVIVANAKTPKGRFSISFDIWYRFQETVKRLMSRAGILFFALLLTTVQELRAEKIDNRNFAVDTFYPTPNEIQLAEQRARKYWAKHGSRFGNNPFYLAVETSKIFPGEVQDLWVKLINSETTGAYFANRRTFSILYLKGIMIFDTRTGHFVSNREFIAVETPPLWGVARFDDYIARYIGFGNWP
jgi:hypothetical protein